MSDEQSFTEWVLDTWDKFGKKDPEPLELLSAPTLTLGGNLPQGDTGFRWTSAVEAMNTYAAGFNTIDDKVRDLVNVRIPEINQAARASIKALIEAINRWALQAQSEPEYIEAITRGFGEVQGVFDRVDEEMWWLAEKKLMEDDLKGTRNNGDGQNGGMPDPDDIPELPPIPDPPPLPDPTPLPEPTPVPTPTPVPDLPGLGSGGQGNGGGSTGMLGMGNDLMSQLMTQMAMRNLFDRGSSFDDRDELERGRRDFERDSELTALPPVQTTAPAAATPWTTSNPPPVTVQPAAAAEVAPAGTVPGEGSGSQTGTRVPDADGNVDYPFYDNRSQRVSAIVAQALDVAFASTDSTSAQIAYAGTTARWAEAEEGTPERAGSPVGPFEVMTGDVATWTKRSAMVVSFGSDGTGTIEAIIDGQFQILEVHDATGELQMSGKDGDFGMFAGFCHPPGIEMSNASAAADTAPTPGAGEQSPVLPADALPA